MYYAEEGGAGAYADEEAVAEGGSAATAGEPEWDGSYAKEEEAPVGEQDDDDEIPEQYRDLY